MGHQQERWKETTRRIRWRLSHPRPTLKQSLGGNKRQVKFEASHLFKKGWPGRSNKTRRGLLAYGVAAVGKNDVNAVEHPPHPCLDDGRLLNALMPTVYRSACRAA